MTLLKQLQNAEIEIPEVMIESEVERMMEEFGQRLTITRHEP